MQNSSRMLLIYIMFFVFTSIIARNDDSISNEIISSNPQECMPINSRIEFARIPDHVKKALATLKMCYPELNCYVDISMLVDDARYCAPLETLKDRTQQVIDLLTASNLTTLESNNEALKIMQQYMQDLETKAACILMEPIAATRILSIYNANTGYAFPSCSELNILGGTNITTSGADSTITINTSGAVADSFPTSSGTATPASGVLNLTGGSNITTTGSGNTVGINLVNSPSVSGSVTAGTGFLATTGGINATGNSLFSSGTLTVNSGTNAINISGDAAATTVNVATGAGAKAVTLGSTTTGSTTTIQAATESGITIHGSATGALVTNGSGSLSTALGLTGGLALMSYGTGATPAFGGNTNTAFGNTIRVDAVNGNNTTATTTNGIPYKTISAALTAAGTIATSSNPVVVWVMPGVYNETLTMQQYVSVIGLSEGAGLTVTSGGTIGTNVGTSGVTIKQTSSTTLVTMAEYSRLENVNLLLNDQSPSATDYGITLSGTMAATARIKSVYIDITVGGTGGAAYGVYSTSSGTPGSEISVLEDCTISIQAASNAGVYGIYNNASTNGNFNMNNCAVSVTLSGTRSNAVCAGIGVLYTGGSSSTIINNSTISVSTSEITSLYAAYGIYGSSVAGTISINNSPITASSSGTAQIYGINGATSTMTIESSPVTVSSTGTTTVIVGTELIGTLNSSPVTVTCSNSGGSSVIVYGIESSSSPTTTINNSPITVSSSLASSTAYGVSYSSGSITINNSPITVSSTAANTVYGVQNTGSGTKCTVTGSAINASSTSTATVYGVYNSASSTGSCTINDSPITASSTTTGTAWGIYNSGTTCNIARSGATVSSGSGLIYGLQNASGTTNIYSSFLNVSGTTSQVYGVYNNGTACTINETPISVTSANTGITTATGNYGVYNTTTCIMNSSPITASSTSTGTVYGLYNTTTATVTGSPITASSEGSTYGVYNASGSCIVNGTPIVASSSFTGVFAYGIYNSTGISTINSSTISGLTGAANGTGASYDISLGGGSLSLNSTKLVNNTINPTGFFTSSPSSLIDWSTTGTRVAGATGFLFPGSSPTGYLNYTGVAITMPHPVIIKNLVATAAVCTTGATSGPVLTLYKNGVATTLAATLGNTGYAQNSTNVISCTGGDQINMAIGSGTGAAGVTATVEMY